MSAASDTVLAYHERTKHHLHRYARSLGYLDWATQPNPFRVYDGAPVTPLPLAADALDATYDALYVPGAIAATAITRNTLGAFFELALGLSAWKRAGEARWALRCNPSSGNLHPTEGYLIARDVPDVLDGVHHYVSLTHSLEHRCAVALELPPECVLIGLTSIHWREAWKYGERAYRYCQHDVGHAIATVCYAAAALGWGAVLLDGAGSTDVGALLGTDRGADRPGAEAEEPETLLLVGPEADARDLDWDALVVAARAGAWRGRANRLSEDHHDWPIIETVARAAVKPRTAPAALPDLPSAPATVAEDSPRAARIIRQRRSAVALDGRTGLRREAFYAMLRRLMPAAAPPWDALPWPPRIHPVLIVHRVADLTPGIYALPRTEEAMPRLRAAVDADFAWRRADGSPDDAPLFVLREGDGRAAAQRISCHQEIAADGVFTLGMLAEFERPLRAAAWRYPRLFWEAGALGQALYLEAEAYGVRATGIGCYFDDAFHELLGLRGRAFQSMYHFTLGGPVDDPRIETLPAYAHLDR